MKQMLRSFFYRYALPYGGLLLIRVISITYRLKVIYPEKRWNEQTRVVFASWHQRFFPGITFFTHFRPIAIMISQSRDGEYIARIAANLGWHPVRGSSTRGGSAALRQLKRLALEGFNIGHIVDGPKGPFGVIKPGLISMAQVVGNPIVPVIVSPHKKWMFNSWDRFMVPKPFSRVIIRFGAPIDVPRRMDADMFEALRLDVENRMKQLYSDTDQMWSDPDRIKLLIKQS